MPYCTMPNTALTAAQVSTTVSSVCAPRAADEAVDERHDQEQHELLAVDQAGARIGRERRRDERGAARRRPAARRTPAPRTARAGRRAAPPSRRARSPAGSARPRSRTGPRRPCRTARARRPVRGRCGRPGAARRGRWRRSRVHLNRCRSLAGFSGSCTCPASAGPRSRLKADTARAARARPLDTCAGVIDVRQRKSPGSQTR